MKRLRGSFPDVRAPYRHCRRGWAIGANDGPVQLLDGQSILAGRAMLRLGLQGIQLYARLLNWNTEGKFLAGRKREWAVGSYDDAGSRVWSLQDRIVIVFKYFL